MKITSRLSGRFGLALVIRLSQRFRWQNEMKLKRAVISVCTWTFSVVLAAAAQSIAAERPPQTSPDTTVLEKGIKEKLESANPDARRPSPSKASPSRSYLKLEPVRSFRHGAVSSPNLHPSYKHCHPGHTLNQNLLGPLDTERITRPSLHPTQKRCHPGHILALTRDIDPIGTDLLGPVSNRWKCRL